MREDWIESELQFIAKIEWGNTSITKKSYELNGYTAYSAAGPDGFLPQAEWFGEGVVLSAIGANCGKCFYADGEWAAIKNTIVIQTVSVNTKYLFHYLNNKFKWKISGTGQPFITLKNARQNLVPLAPLTEQRAIVAKIEELFSDLDKGVADLRKAQDQLKVYRQAVLKKAFEGELTKSKDLLNKTKLKKIVRFSQGIQVPKQDQKLNFQKGDVRFLRIIDFTQGKDSPRFIKNPGVKYIVSSDDISMVRYGASTGHICTGINGAIANNIFRIIPTVQLENKFLFYFFKSPYFLEILKKRVKGVAMPAISFGLLNDIEINFTSDERQQNLIVKAIESRLSVCDKVEESINESLEKSKALRQSILKKAFEGTLLSKDEIEKCKTAPDYEPAAVLLEKIKNL